MRSLAREYRKLATDLQLDPAANTVERGVDILDDLVRAIGRVGES